MPKKRWRYIATPFILALATLAPIQSAHAITAITVPATAGASTTGFTLISASGTTPSITGFGGSDTVQVVITATGAKVKISETTGLSAPTGYTTAQWVADTSAEISFKGLQADVSASLATLQTKADTLGTSGSISIRAFVAGPAYNAANGHYYEVITNMVSGTETAIDWPDARCIAKYATARYSSGSSQADKCGSTNSETRRTYAGLNGYLVTLTSQAEQDFLFTKLTTPGWIGGTDKDLEGTWKWADGPEAGQTFFLKTADVLTTSTRRTVNTINSISQFNFFNDDEPNNAGIENYAEFGFGLAGEWNDCNVGCGPVRSKYIIEYGGDGGTSSVASASITVATIPTAPGAGTVTQLSATSVSVGYTAPSSNGGSAVIDYTVTSTPGGITATGSSSPVTVSGLTAGTSYTFTVTARNIAGSSASSSASSSITPDTAPNAPTIGTATVAGATSASVAFTAPTSNGSTAVLDYTVTSSPGSITATGSSSPLTVSGLTAGQAYTFTVKARNATGLSSASSASSSITPNLVPAAPTSVGGTSGNAQVSLAWTAPASNGGTAVTGYFIEKKVSSTWSTVVSNTSSTSTTYTATGLTNGTTYNFRVTAINSLGAGAASTESTSVVPRDPAANADLSNLVVTTASIGTFDSQTTSYSATVADTVASVTVTPTLSNGSASVQVNGATVTSGSPSSSIALTTGSNTVTVVVTAQNGTTTKSYTISITRSAPAQSGGGQATPPAPVAPVVPIDPAQVVDLSKDPNANNINWNSNGPVVITITNSAGVSTNQVISGGNFLAPKPVAGEAITVTVAEQGANGTVLKTIQLASPPGSVQGLKVVEIASKKLEATWNPTSTIKKYLVTITPKVGAPSKIETADPKLTVLTAPGQDYKFEVVAVGYGNLKSAPLLEIKLVGAGEPVNPIFSTTQTSNIQKLDGSRMIKLAKAMLKVEPGSSVLVTATVRTRAQQFKAARTAIDAATKIQSVRKNLWVQTKVVVNPKATVASQRVSLNVNVIIRPVANR